MKKQQKLADEILANHPDQNVVYITEDNQPFFSPIKAKNHAAYRKHDKEPKAFFREGSEPEDETELQAKYEKVQSRNTIVEAVLEAIGNAANLEIPAEEITPETPQEVVAVLELREEFEEANLKANQLETALNKANEAKAAVEAELKKLKETPVKEEPVKANK
ncbi:MAG: hypothetical protein ABGW88_13700 [Leeuwenhoekiella sp.]|uniref:hypothetical protein n=1 Tax=Leeuwenhoekiella sp. TaxID=1977054 RepID=UPI00324204B8